MKAPFVLMTCALGLILPMRGDSAGFDCAKAATDAEKAICADPNLSRLDDEVARLYALAQTSSHAKADQLKAMQIGFIKGREDCWKASDLSICLRDETAIRIAELRQGYAEARSQDDKGISNGPFALSCPGFDFGISITFINAEDSLAYAAWKDMSVVLPTVPTGSGAHYEAEIDGQTYSIWTKGDDAIVTLPGLPEQNGCRIEVVG